MEIFGILLALAGGIFIAVQGSINSMVGSTVGVFTTVIIPVWLQAIYMTAALLLNGTYMSQLISVKDHKSMILWLFAAAVLGTGIMLSITLSFMKIGPLLALSLIVFSQLGISMVIEHFGLFGTAIAPITLTRVAGLGAILVGVYLFSK